MGVEGVEMWSQLSISICRMSKINKIAVESWLRRHVAELAVESSSMLSDSRDLGTVGACFGYGDGEHLRGDSRERHELGCPPV